MKKSITLCLIACAFTSSNNAFGMLIRKSITYTKNSNSYCTTNKLLLTQLVKNRRQIKNCNNDLIELMTEQNKIINQLDTFNRPMPDIEYALIEDRITACTQRLLALEQQIRK
jgi:hypothetical protein